MKCSLHKKNTRRCIGCELALLRKMAKVKVDQSKANGEEYTDLSMEHAKLLAEWEDLYG